MCNSCLTMDEFYDQLKYCQLRIFTQSSYLDFGNIDNPLMKKGDLNFVYIQKNSFTRMNINVVQNNFSIEDSLIFSSTKDDYFYSIEPTSYSVGTEEYQNYYGFLGVVQLKLGEIKNQYEVKIYNFYDLIAQIGGIYGIIYECIGLFAFYIAKRMYEYSLIKTITSDMQSIDLDQSSSLDNINDLKKNSPPEISQKKSSFNQQLHEPDKISSDIKERKRIKSNIITTYTRRYNFADLLNSILCPLKI